MNTYLGASSLLRPRRRRRRPRRLGPHHLPRGLPLRPSRGQGRLPQGVGHRPRRRPQGGADAVRHLLRRTPPRRVARRWSSTHVDILFANEARARGALRRRSSTRPSSRPRAEVELTCVTLGPRGSLLVTRRRGRRGRGRAGRQGGRHHRRRRPLRRRRAATASARARRSPSAAASARWPRRRSSATPVPDPGSRSPNWPDVSPAPIRTPRAAGGGRALAAADRRRPRTTSLWCSAPAGVRPPTPSATPIVAFPPPSCPASPRRSSSGHGGELRSIRVGDRRVLVSLGRVHAYEGHDLADRRPRRAHRRPRPAARTVVLTNAAGGIGPGLRHRPAGAHRRPPEPHRPLAAHRPGTRRVLGPRFPDMTDAYSRPAPCPGPDARPDPGRGRLRRRRRPAVRDAGRDPHDADARRRPRGHVDGARGHRRACTSAPRSSASRWSPTWPPGSATALDHDDVLAVAGESAERDGRPAGPVGRRSCDRRRHRRRLGARCRGLARRRPRPRHRRRGRRAARRRRRRRPARALRRRADLRHRRPARAARRRPQPHEPRRGPAHGRRRWPLARRHGVARPGGGRPRRPPRFATFAADTAAVLAGDGPRRSCSPAEPGARRPCWPTR